MCTRLPEKWQHWVNTWTWSAIVWWYSFNHVNMAASDLVCSHKVCAKNIRGGIVVNNVLNECKMIKKYNFEEQHMSKNAQCPVRCWNRCKNKQHVNPNINLNNNNNIACVSMLHLSYGSYGTVLHRQFDVDKCDCHRFLSLL